MKVSRQSSSRLTLRSLPWFLWLFSVGLIGGGVLVSTVMTGRSVLECDRTAHPRCTLTHASALRQQTKTFALDSLTGADVDTGSGSDGETVYRVQLLTREGPVPLTQSYNNHWLLAQDQAEQINRFIQDPAISALYLSRGNRWLGWTAMLFFGGGGLLLLNTKVVHCEFDQQKNQCTLRLYGLTGQQCHQIPLQRILGIRVDMLGGAKGRDDSDKPSARLAIVLKNGEAVPISTIYASSPDSQAQIARQVHEFLRLPPLPQWDASQVTLDQAGIALELLAGGVSRQQAAIEDCQQALRQDPGNVQACQQMATALSLQKRPDEAKTLLETARSRCQGEGKHEQAAHLDQVLSLLKLKGKSPWWKAF